MLKIIKRIPVSWTCLIVLTYFTIQRSDAIVVGNDVESYVEAWNAYARKTKSEAPGATLQEGCAPLRIEGTKPIKGVVVLFHGYSACPQQYDLLGPEIASRGFDVLLPLNPGHGYASVDLVTHTLSLSVVALTSCVCVCGLMVLAASRTGTCRPIAARIVCTDANVKMWTI